MLIYSFFAKWYTLMAPASSIILGMLIVRYTTLPLVSLGEISSSRTLNETANRFFSSQSVYMFMLLSNASLSVSLHVYVVIKCKSVSQFTCLCSYQLHVCQSVYKWFSHSDNTCCSLHLIPITCQLQVCQSVYKCFSHSDTTCCSLHLIPITCQLQVCQSV